MCRQSPASGCPGNIPKTTRLLGGCNWSPACTQSSGCARGVLSACKKGWSPIGQASGPRVRGAVVQGVVRLEAVRVCTGLRRMAARAAE